VSLAGVHRLGRDAKPVAASRLHLDQDQPVAVPADQVDLAAPRQEAPSQHPVSVPFQVLRSQLLATPA
jgi:hypothetical protein